MSPITGSAQQPGDCEVTVKDNQKNVIAVPTSLDISESPAPVVGLSNVQSSTGLIPVGSAKSQKQITLLGEDIVWGSSEIDRNASSTDGYTTKALRTFNIFQECHKARDFNSADSKAA